MATRGFSGSLIANTISYFKKWSIQDGGSRMSDCIIGNIELNRIEIAIWVFPGSLIANTISDIRNWPIQDGGSKMVDPRWRNG